jgi:hypothetical protein
LLVVFIPGLLMLATFGLERLESGLTRDSGTASEVAKLLQHARVADVTAPPRDGPPRRLTERDAANDPLPTRLAPPSLPTRVYFEHSPNPQFQPTRHANRV